MTTDTPRPADQTLSQLVPLNQAREIAGLPVTLSTCIRWASIGAIPATRIGGRWFANPAALKGAVVHTQVSDRALWRRATGRDPSTEKPA